MSKRKLLLADDSITIQKVVNLTFADEGIEVISVGDGDSAMRKFDEFMPDLVMADVNMPGLNGYEVCRIIKVTEETQHIPVILLVGSFEPFDEAEARDAGADDFLTKPFQSIRQLVNKVTDLLNRRDRPAPPEEQSEAESPAAPVVDSFADTLEFEKQTADADEFEQKQQFEPQEPETASSFEADPAAETPDDSSRQQETSGGFEQAENVADFENRREISSEFGDAGMDDEMIEASPANDYVSGFDQSYQRETSIDYAKTQPLSAQDLQGFDLGARAETEQASPQSAADENQAYFAGESEASEPPSFDEEARKLGEGQNYEDAEKRSEVIAENEPEIDYYLPVEPKFEKEVSDAETLAPEISYMPDEDAREADFSQAPEEDLTKGESEFEEPESRQVQTENETSVAQETRLREVAEGAEAMPEAEIDLSQTGETYEEPESGREEEEFSTEKAETREYREAETENETTPEPAETEKIREFEPVAEQAPGTETETVSDVRQETEERPESELKTAEFAEFDAATEQTPEEETEAHPEREMISEAPFAAASAANTSELDFEDGDLLELPPLVEETGIRPQPKPPALVPEIVAAEPPPPAPEPESKITVTKTVAESEIALSFPPELIEAIAQKVAEKISAKALTEVLPQITELVVRKLAEENRESKK